MLTGIIVKVIVIVLVKRLFVYIQYFYSSCLSYLSIHLFIYPSISVHLIQELSSDSQGPLPSARRSKYQKMSEAELDSVFSNKLRFSDTTSKETQSRVDELMRLSRSNRSDAQSFLERLKTTSMQRREQLLSGGDSARPSSKK